MSGVLLKIMMFVLMFSILVCIKNLFSVIKAFLNKTQIEFSKCNMLTLGLSISYIGTIIFTGFNF